MGKKLTHKRKHKKKCATANIKSALQTKPTTSDKTNQEERKAYEQRLQRRLLLLRKHFEEGKIRIPKDPQLEKSLLAMRYAPDGSVDLNTVDGVVRSMALAVEGLSTKKNLILSSNWAGCLPKR
jgi:hypothetical protein